MMCATCTLTVLTLMNCLRRYVAVGASLSNQCKDLLLARGEDAVSLRHPWEVFSWVTDCLAVPRGDQPHPELAKLSPYEKEIGFR